MNFNITAKADYSLQARHTHELIQLYGVKTKLILTEKVNYDASVFGDYSSIKTKPGEVYDLFMLPENSEEFDDVGINFSEFGMLNVESVRLFVSRKSLETVFGEGDYIKPLMSNLIVLPNNRVMEITDVQFMVPGINNLFSEKDTKNVYKLALKNYEVKLTDDLESFKDSGNDAEEDVLVGAYDELDSYFDELTGVKNELDNEAKNEIDKDTGKVVVDDADSVFGRF